MQETYYDEFEKNWEKFTTQLQGQIMTQAQKGVLVHSVLNLILADCVGFWDSKYSEGGRWLDRYETEYPKKADMIRDIFLNDMKFTDEGEKSSDLEALKYIVPVGTAIAGFAVSGFGKAGMLARAACTVVPAAVAYPIATNIVNIKSDDAKENLIQAYMKQLDKYKLSIESILQSSDKGV